MRRKDKESKGDEGSTTPNRAIYNTCPQLHVFAWPSPYQIRSTHRLILTLHDVIHTVMNLARNYAFHSTKIRALLCSARSLSTLPPRDPEKINVSHANFISNADSNSKWDEQKANNVDRLVPGRGQNRHLSLISLLVHTNMRPIL